MKNIQLFKVIGLVLTGLLLASCAKVQVKELDDDKFLLEQQRSGMANNYESRAMKKQAKKVCPIGYRHILRQSFAGQEMAEHRAQCALGANCGFVLQWQIECTDIPAEPFSLFGKS